MRCAQCESENREGRGFCARCGAPLALGCSACGFANEPGSVFCGGCGLALVQRAATGPGAPAGFASPATYTPRHLVERILTSRSALEGERKVVTVLFADVTGFTALSDKLDPEDVHQIMDGAFELMLFEVHRYEGTVNQFLGDGLMALFGAPLAHEDHAQRAVHAALALQRALGAYRAKLSAERGIDFQVRMGLNTGLVVVGKIGDNLRMDYTAVGDTTNLAARLLALAEPDQILVGDDTAKAASPFFVLRPLGEVAVKGKAQPVRAHRVEGARAIRTRLEAESERGLTPLVGRERELTLLRERFDEVHATRGQAVFVFGEAGIGKSRLVLEFRRHAEAAGARWIAGRCVSYGRGIAYLPVLDLLRDLLDLKEGDSVESRLEKVDRQIRAIGDDLVWTVPLIRALLSLDPGDPAVFQMNPIHRRGRTDEAMRALLVEAGRQCPLVAVVEDLHWIDTHSEDALKLLLEGVAAAPVMLLLTYRPGYTQPFGERTYHTRITLHALPDVETTRMIERVLRSADVPDEARALIARRSEGNPLFVEELTKALVEDGTLARVDGGYRLARPLGDAIPDTIEGVIMARIDRLPEACKATLQVAAVIGREFTGRLVERVSGRPDEFRQALAELRAVELIYEKATYPEPLYTFKHALTHDVAYENLLRQQRRDLHRRAGEVIEELYADRLAEVYETLARHFTRGEAWGKTVDYSTLAAAKARGNHAYAEGSRFAAEAAAILERTEAAPADRARALEVFADLESLQGLIESSNRAYDQALALVESSDDRLRIENKRHRLGFAVRDGARIAYYEHGAGEPTVVMMHPSIYGIALFQPLVEILCQQFRVITFDPQGTGASDLVTRPHRKRDHAEDARAVIEATGTRPVVFVGISDSSRIGILLAAAHPHLVAKLVLIGTQIGTLEETARELDDRYREYLEVIRAGDWVRASVLQNALVYTDPGTHHMLDYRLKSIQGLPLMVLRGFYDPADPDWDVRPVLPSIRVPTLVMHGGEDRLVPVSRAHEVAAAIPGAQLHIFEGSGHVLVSAAPRPIMVLWSFISAVTPS